MAQIERAGRADQELWEAFQRLVPQLTDNNPPPSLEDLQALLQSESASLFLARGGEGKIIGAAALTLYRVPTGIRAVIEDVVVDREARGQGLGEALVRAALDYARDHGAPAVTLTSNPKREAANALYQKMGFLRRYTNAYVYKFRSGLTTELTENTEK